ncbi:hypothetical protein C7J88_07460 [Staphylococcus muscae]|uniref:Uncharacterized protein n=1 Tax=Staphylococcus muscae TaxID=1294 RepID=A0A240BR88_9STAP|nr:hypothetical protein [Staphylococcus muscae]AVQ34023.1 hypothetical protein C7J88_07460 [Staphylococcus muscae]GGA82392.1 hypothetical protein GCM10007183_03250 [Staphylococcus muscae]SNV98377.1 Uncharacterised protein [Staphylococcus muscae]
MIDLNELMTNSKILYLIIGSILTLITGTIAFAIQSLFKGIYKRKGRLHIFYKHIQGKASNTKAQIIKHKENEFQINIPLWVEFLNTTQVNKVVRDFNLVAYYKGNKIKDFKQINEYSKQRLPLANDGAYSFLIEGHNIQKYELYFILKTSNEIDEIKIRYYNLKNKPKTYNFLILDDNLLSGEINLDNHWNKIN